MMKRLLMIVMILALAPATSQAQSILRRLERTARSAAERTVERKVEEKVEEGVNKAIDKAFEEKETEESASSQASGATSRQASDTASPQDPAPASPQNKRAEIAWSKSDFVPGDEIFFEDNLTGEKMGEFPSQWDILQGNAEVAQIDGANAILLSDDANLAPLMENPKAFLPEIFTLEFDFFLNEMTEENSDSGFSRYHVLFYDNKSGEYEDTDNNTMELDWYPPYGEIECHYSTASYEDRSASAQLELNFGEWNHLAISFNKRALKIYINGIRIINLPNVAAPMRFSIGQGWSQPNTAFIRNVRLAKGAVPLYDRMMQDEKFISYGITFDVSKSVIKPESAGELTRIVQLLKENPSLRFSVEGHTDATGSASANQTLSEARAEAVVARLVEMGIDRSRLSAKGLGQNSPIADNSTDEGRAKKRRVEFVKL
ncbi:MAG TPA: OmpA family protein [Bacteroidales bacterium]|jgi:outer membrane protein OmpA-like peptidoglycan-associated protein|nr:OmpA family protein [Bacteroidales bacterium]HQB58989.1 OmpA family protein [Bacteroidales bacterium]HQM58403.1 OmpA family protein [Bacteroidales bacterium]HQM98780.1 OmpA family protein [Bacteroidales bacterium]